MLEIKITTNLFSYFILFFYSKEEEINKKFINYTKIRHCFFMD